MTGVARAFRLSYYACVVLPLYSVPNSITSMPVLKVSGSTYTRSRPLPPSSNILALPVDSSCKSYSMLACTLAHFCPHSAMTSDATPAIWAHTGSNHTWLKIQSNSFVMMCAVLVAQTYRKHLDKEPDAKDAAAHWRSVMSYLRDQQQCETRAGRPSQYDRQAIPVRPPLVHCSVLIICTNTRQTGHV